MPEIGKLMNIEFAKSLSGHDKDQYYLIKEKDETFVYLVNGTNRPFTAPKKKNARHIQPVKKIPAEVAECLAGGLTDTNIKRAIKTYERMIQGAENH